MIDRNIKSLDRRYVQKMMHALYELPVMYFTYMYIRKICTAPCLCLFNVLFFCCFFLSFIVVIPGMSITIEIVTYFRMYTEVTVLFLLFN